MILRLAIFLFGVSAARAGVELTGILVAANDTLFTLSEKGTNMSSEWIKAGDSFDGYTIVSFDRDTEVLDVRSHGVIQHLQIRASKIVQGNHESPPGKPIDLDRRRIERFGSLGELILADVRSDSSFTYITPREVWKGSVYLVGKTFSIRNPNTFDSMTVNGAATIILALPSTDPFVAGSPMMAAGTDGQRMGGPKGILLDQFRDYYRPTEDHAASAP